MLYWWLGRHTWWIKGGRLYSIHGLNTLVQIRTWGALGWLNTQCLIVYVLRGSSIGYLATLVPVGSVHRLYMYFTQKVINNNYKLSWDSWKMTSIESIHFTHAWSLTKGVRSRSIPHSKQSNAWPCSDLAGKLKVHLLHVHVVLLNDLNTV